MKTTIPNLSYEDHVKFINIALNLAKKSDMDVPIASLIVLNGEIIASSCNEKEKRNDPTAHAEMIVIKEASKQLQRWRLNDVIIYSTLEPCPMCAGAILSSRIPVIVFSAYDNIYGALGSVINMAELYNFYNPQVLGGIEENKARELLRNFFREEKREEFL